MLYPCSFKILVYCQLVLILFLYVLSFVQGVRNLKGTDLNAVYVLIKPPSIEVLEQRLRDRNTETEESLKRRLSIAKEELDYGKWIYSCGN